MTTYAYSTDEEHYEEIGDFDSHQSAFAELVESGAADGCGTVWIARKVPVFESSFVRDDLAERILEDVNEDACDNAGEFAGDWPEADQKLVDELSKEIKTCVVNWLKKHAPAHFWLVEDDKKFQIPEQ